MAEDLASFVTPWRAAVVTSEIQNGVLGEPSVFPELAGVARETMIPATARLVKAARVAGVQVIHCTFSHRPDFKATNTNARLFLSARQSPVRLSRGGANAAVIPEVGAEPDDLVLTRAHGLNPMAGTDLDPVLRNLDLRTIVVAGVSVNVAITNLVIGCRQPRLRRRAATRRRVRRPRRLRRGHHRQHAQPAGHADHGRRAGRDLVEAVATAGGSVR
jgi:nicotinamidase-related amidase